MMNICPHSDRNSCEQYRLKGQYCQDCPLPAVANAMLELQRALAQVSGEAAPQLLEIRVTPELWHILRLLPEPFVTHSYDALTVVGVAIHVGRSS